LAWFSFSLLSTIYQKNRKTYIAYFKRMLKK
jgi:hypothetical protein